MTGIFVSKGYSLVEARRDIMSIMAGAAGLSREVPA